jgi:hypothetical protein
MKKIILAISTIAIFAISAYAFGTLTGESSAQFGKKHCHYSDGSIITISSVGLCPLSN